ncbi:hypothetical protein ACTXT7_001532 [Hymenolepis weldensis]
MHLLAVLEETAGNRFSSEDQEYLIWACFIAQVYPPPLQAHLRPLERAGIAEFIKAVNISSTTLGNHNHSQAPSSPSLGQRPIINQCSPYRHPGPT